MTESFNGKVVLISGASRGLGRALTLGFAQRGASIAAFAKDVSRLEEVSSLLESLQTPFLCYSIDIRDELAVKAFIEALMNKFTRVDVLINNAAIVGPRVEIASYPAQTWRDVIDINLTGTFLLTKEVLPIMKRQRHGSIINVGSSVGRVGSKLWGAYCPAKFGLEGFTQELADEVRQYGIRVNSVDPGAMRTDMRRQAYPTENPGKHKKPEELLDMFFYLASDESKNITGQSLQAHEFPQPA